MQSADSPYNTTVRLSVAAPTTHLAVGIYGSVPKCSQRKVKIAQNTGNVSIRPLPDWLAHRAGLQCRTQQCLPEAQPTAAHKLLAQQEVKRKGVPVHTMKAHGKVKETPPSFLPLKLDRDDRSASHPIRFTSGEKPPVADGLQRQSGRSGEGNTSFPCVGVQPVAQSLYRLTYPSSRNTQATVSKSTSVVYNAASKEFVRS